MLHKPEVRTHDDEKDRGRHFANHRVREDAVLPDHLLGDIGDQQEEVWRHGIPYRRPHLHRILQLGTPLRMAANMEDWKMESIQSHHRSGNPQILHKLCQSTESKALAKASLRTSVGVFLLQ